MAVEGKIAVEEHFMGSGMDGCLVDAGWDKEVWERVARDLEDVDERRIPEMDRNGVGFAVLSLCSDGIQGMSDRAEAIETAQRANEALAEIVRAHPDRIGGFAAVALQDPAAAAEEAERAVRELGFVGVLANGFSDDEDGVPLYYDAPEYGPFWERMNELGVPFYLHPRDPWVGERNTYKGREELLSAPWAFAVETGTHALRLVTSGLFDRYPNVQVILGHLGEQLPFAISRFEQRISNNPKVKLEKPPRQAFREHFYVTTSGNTHTPSLLGALLEMGAERVLFACDYPFERMADGATWFDALPISDADKAKIGRDNARGLLGL